MDKEGNKAAINVEEYYGRPNGQKYEVKGSNRKWTNLQDITKKFMKERPRYNILDNNCFNYADYMLINFAEGYDGVAKRENMENIRFLSRINNL